MTLLSTDWFLLKRSSNGQCRKIKGENLFNFDSINLNGYQVIVQKGTQSFRCEITELSYKYLVAGEPDDWYMLVNRGDKSYKAKVTNVLNDFNGLTPGNILRWWAERNGFVMKAPRCEGATGDPYDLFFINSSLNTAAYMSIEPSSFDAVINSGYAVAVRQIELPNLGGKTFNSVTRNGCTSEFEGASGWVASNIEVAYYDPDTDLYRRKDTGSNFTTFDPYA